MLLNQRTEGFIFRRENRLEADSVLSIFTKDFGRIEILAKALRKINAKLRSGSELFSFSEIEFIQGKNQKTLTDAMVISRFPSISISPEKRQTAYAMADVLDSLIKGQEPDDNLLNLVITTYEKLDSLAVEKRFLVFEYFFWNLLDILGYKPELSCCSLCRANLVPESIYFSFKDGGLICHRCATSIYDKIKVHQDIIKCYRLFLKREIDLLERLKIESNLQKKFREISAQYYRYIASHPLSQVNH